MISVLSGRLILTESGASPCGAPQSLHRYTEHLILHKMCTSPPKGNSLNVWNKLGRGKAVQIFYIFKNKPAVCVFILILY